MTESATAVPIPLADLVTTHRTLFTLFRRLFQLERGTEAPRAAALAEARRQVEIEVRRTYGDDAWEAMVNG